MLKLRTILLCRWPYYLILAVAILTTILSEWIPPKSHYQGTETEVVGKIIEQWLDGNQLLVTIKAKEVLTGTYYFSMKQEKEAYQKNFELGDVVCLKGTLEEIPRQTVPFLFSYHDMAKRKGQFFTMKIESFQKIKENNNLLYRIQNQIAKRIETLPHQEYVQAFLLGNTKGIDPEVRRSYQENGISHLFAVSGMHISLFSGGILFVLQKLKVKEGSRYFITILFLLFYLLLTKGSPSVLRATIFFILLSINRIFYFYIPPLRLFYLTLALVLFYHPWFIYDVGFQFSFLISFSLLLFSDWLQKSSHYFISLFKVSFLAFVASVPIALFHFSQLNFFSAFYNLYFVPLISLVVFPLALLTFFFHSWVSFFIG